MFRNKITSMLILTAICIMTIFCFSAQASPDVIVSAITKISDTQYSVTIKNQGDAFAMYMGDVRINTDGVYHTYLSCDAIGPGLSRTLSLGKTFTAAGNHTIEAIADYGNKMVESNESNNSKTVTVTTGGTYKPDLIVSAITKISDTQYSVTVKNQGNAMASPIGNVRIYADGVYHTLLLCDAIGAGLSRTINFSKTFTNAGNHTIQAVADYENRSIESNESNNSKTVTVTTGGTYKPDLIVSAITKISNTQYSVTVKNQGNAMASPIGNVRIYTDGAYHTLLLCDAIGAGLSRTLTFVKNFSSLGTHTIQAVADYENRSIESNESNNSKTVTVTLY